MRHAALLAMILALPLAACDRKQPAASPPEGMRVAPSLDAGPPQPPGDAANPRAFTPLRSAQVKDALYRAMKTGETQRWQDGGLSGYAVPSVAKGIYGCRAVRYTIDQLPLDTPQTVNACE